MAEKKCNQSGCTFNVDGKCLEGLGESCSHLLVGDATQVRNTIVEPTEKKKDPNNIQLFNGEEFGIDQIHKISHKYSYKLITILGDVNCGKTTLLAVLFDLFQIGPFEEFLFAGSLSQIGFEKRGHFARLSSKGNAPDTPRTISTDFKFLHIAIKKKSELAKSAINLLLSDVSGERCKRARNNSSSMKELSFIKNSDHIIIMIDGQNILNPRERHSEIFNAETFIQKALEEGIFDNKTKLKIIVSKWDILNDDSTFNFTETIENTFNQKFSSKLNRIEYAKIASRPYLQNERIKMGFGLHDLLKEWCSAKEKPVEVFEEIQIDRSFNKYRFKGN